MSLIKIRNCIRAVFIILSLSSFGNAYAIASAIAEGSDAYGWATRDTQAEANKMALKACNQKSPKKDCKLDPTLELVRTEGGGHYGIARSADSYAVTKKAALEQCGNDQCKITFVLTDPGFYSVAKPIDGGNYYITYQYRDLRKAQEEAKAGCEESNGADCKVIWYGVLPGQYSVDPAPKPRPVANLEKNCRPNTPSIRCSSQCTNGSCIVTYENGCKMRVQVQPRFDPFTNQWTYPSPSC